MFGLGYISSGAGEEAIGRLVMVVIPQLLTGSAGLTMNLGSMPDPEDSDLGLRKGSRSGGRPDGVVELGMLGGPGVLGVEEDFPLEEMFAFVLLCFLYLT